MKITSKVKKETFREEDVKRKFRYKVQVEDEGRETQDKEEVRGGGWQV